MISRANRPRSGQCPDQRRGKNKTFELVAERGEAQQDLTPLFADLQTDDPQKNDGVLDMDNMPLREEPDCIINELNLY